MGEHDLLTISEVAKYLRVTERTIRDMIHRGEIKAIKLGKAYRIKKADIESMFTQQSETEK
jgi:PTS system nitrogen regulatory IIA component